MERLGGMVGSVEQLKASYSTQETSHRDVSTVAIGICPFAPVCKGRERKFDSIIFTIPAEPENQILMKVVLAAKSVYPFHPFGGVQKYVYYFASYLAQTGIDVEIVAPLDTGRPRTEIFDGLKFTFLRPSIFRYLEYPVGWLGVHLFSWSLAQYLKKLKFDLLHSFDMTAYQYLKFPKRQPVIAHIFTDNYLCNPISSKELGHLLNLTGKRFSEIKKKKLKISPFSGPALKRQYYLHYLFKVKPMHSSLTRADMVFCEEENSRREVGEIFKLPFEKIDILPVGVGVQLIAQHLKGSQAGRLDVQLSEKDIVLLTANRLAADKGVDKIVLALAEIIQEFPQVKLIIVGSGYQERELNQLIKDKNLAAHVRHFQNIPEEKLYDLLKISDIYLCAFSYPGSSLSTLEAMACSLPIVTTAQPWLIKKGENGVFLEENEPAAIKEAVVSLIKENRLKPMGNVSFEIVERYDWKSIAQDAIRKYRKILAKG